MQNDKPRPIIIRRVTKKSHGHHGGAWKVAYADFMTAMMAFFPLLWLLSTTEEDKLKGIADFFTPNVIPLTNIGGEGVTDGSSLSEEDLLGEVVPEEKQLAEQEAEGQPEAASDGNNASGAENPWARFVNDESIVTQGRIQNLVNDLTQRLDPYADTVRVHEKNGNVVIDLLDLKEYPLFASASAQLTAETMPIVQEISSILQEIGGPVIVTGHTDAVPFARTAGYGNWELSADRANAMRRAIISEGIPEGRIMRVAGAADTDPLNREHPEAPENRRVSIEIATGE